MPGKKGHRGWGHIRQLSNKSRRFQASYIGPDFVRHYAPRTFTARMDAEAWLTAERRLIERDEWMPPKARTALRRATSIPLGEYAQTWIAQRTLKPRTRAGYSDSLRLYIAPTLGKVPMRNLTGEAVRAWWASLGSDHPSRNAGAYALLRAICMTAVADGLLGSNPCQIARASTPARKRQPVILDVAEIAALADAIEPAPCRIWGWR